MRLNSGEYVISDPCYVFDNAKYSRFLDETDYFGCAYMGGVFKDSVTWKLFAVFSTKWGDGSYEDNVGRVYAVDAGCIGCIPIELCDITSGRYIHRHTFDKPFDVYYDNGKIHFGDVIIDTDPGFEDADDYEDEDEDEEQ